MDINKNEKFLQALEMLDYGYQVIPFSQDKNFFLVPWKKYQTQRVTEKELEEWWTRHPTANVGFITGELSGFTVIDFDVGSDGKITQEQMEIANKLPPTLTIRTPSNGYHYYYRYNAKIKQTSFKTLKIDVRNDGGLIGGWNNYCEYTKKETGTIVKGFYKVVEEKGRDMAELPEKLFEELFNVKKLTPKEEREFESKDWTELPESYRNEYFFKYAASLFGRKMKKAEVVDYFKLKYDKLQNKVDFTWNEVMNCIDSASKFEIIDSKNVDMSGYKGEDELISSLDIAKKVKEKSYTLLNTGFEHLNEITDGGFLENDFIVLSGEAKSGKTDICMQLARNMEEYNPVFLAMEDSIEDQLARKFRKYGDIEKAKYLTFQAKPKEGFNLDWVILKIKEGVQKVGSKIIFIDNLEWFESKDANYAAQKEVFRALKSLCDEFKICIVLVVHIKGDASYAYGTRRPDVQRLKGGSHIYQMATKVLMVWRVKIAIKEDRIDAGYTKIILALDRFSGNNDAEFSVEYRKGVFIELTDEEVRVYKEREAEMKKKK